MKGFETQLLLVGFVLFLLIFNKETRIFKLFSVTLNKKLIFYIVGPIIVSFVSVKNFDFKISIEVSELLAGVFSRSFTLLFGFAAVLTPKMAVCPKVNVIKSFKTVLLAVSLLLICTILSLTVRSCPASLIPFWSGMILCFSLNFIELILYLISQIASVFNL